MDKITKIRDYRICFKHGDKYYSISEIDDVYEEGLILSRKESFGYTQITGKYSHFIGLSDFLRVKGDKFYADPYRHGQTLSVFDAERLVEKVKEVFGVEL